MTIKIARLIGALIGIILAVLLVSACEQLLVGGLPAGRVSLAVQGTAPSSVATASNGSMVTMAAGDGSVEIPAIGVSGAQIGTITLVEARVAVKEIEFELAETDDHADEEAEQEADETETDFEGPFIVDLITNTMTPEPDITALIAGTYEEIEIELDTIEGDEVGDDGETPAVAATDPLFGRSIYLEGTYANTAGTLTDVPFVLAFELEDEWELTGTGGESLGFVIDRNTINSIIIAFRLNTWFDFSNPETTLNVDLTDLTSDAGFDPVTGIVLDESEAAAAAVVESIREVIKENIEESADYGEDDDGDGELSSEEDDDPDSEDEDDS